MLCAHWHRFFPLKKGLSKTHQSSLTLKFFLKSPRPSLPLKRAPPLSPSPFPLRGQGMCQPPYSVLKPLRYKVGGPSEVFASSRAAFCGMRPHGHKSLTSCRKSMKTIATRPEGACYFYGLHDLWCELLIWAFNYPIRPVVRINSERQEWISNCFFLRPANVVSLILDKRITLRLLYFVSWLKNIISRGLKQ